MEASVKADQLPATYLLFSPTPNEHPAFACNPPPAKPDPLSTISSQPSTRSSLRELLNHFLKLLTDYRSVEAIDGNVKPIAFFPFHYEVS